MKHNLPAIESVDVLEGMPHRFLKVYHQNYCPMREGVDGRLPNTTRIREVLIAIGCTAPPLPAAH